MCRVRVGRPGRVRCAHHGARACGGGLACLVSSSWAHRARACGLGRPAGRRGTRSSACRPCGRIDVAGVCFVVVLVSLAVASLGPDVHSARRS
eukprot:8125968-Alexandrium_andersonii.AAC.1